MTSFPAFPVRALFVASPVMLSSFVPPMIFSKSLNLSVSAPAVASLKPLPSSADVRSIVTESVMSEKLMVSIPVSYTHLTLPTILLV